MNILLVGHVCIDENISEKVTYKSWGSALMYMSKYFMTKPDCNTSLLAPYGNDFLEYLDGISMLSKPNASRTLIYKNETKVGKRTQRVEQASEAEPIALTKEIGKTVAEADVIVVATLIPNYSFSYLSKLLNNKRKDCLTVLLPQGYLRNISSSDLVEYREFREAYKIIPLFDLLFVSNEDIPNAKVTLESWAKQIPGTNMVMTEGKKGASIIKDSETVRISTQSVPKDKIVDSVGCGDTFSAATIYEYFHNADLEKAISVGNAVAGEKLRSVSPLS